MKRILEILWAYIRLPFVLIGAISMTMVYLLFLSEIKNIKQFFSQTYWGIMLILMFIVMPIAGLIIPNYIQKLYFVSNHLT